VVRPAHAATVPSGKRVAVFIWLKGSPLGANPHFRARTARTHYHYLLDPALPGARWYSARMLKYHQREVTYLRSLHVDIQVERFFTILFNGIGASIPQSQLGTLSRAANVTAVTIQHPARPLLDKSIGLIHAEQAWPVVGGEANAGKGVFIAQIDSGIDITNPCFSDKGMPAPPSFLRGRGDPALENNKVVVARVYGPTPGEKYSAEDVLGHGTFGAAIEACDYNTKTPVGTLVSGVAPAAYLMSYNVFPGYPSGESYSYDNFLPALEDAISDGADIVNYSAGSSLGADDYRLDADEQAIEVAVRNGVSVVVAAGNAGPEMQSTSSPSAAPDAIAAGATTNAHAIQTAIDIGGAVAPPSSLSTIQAMPSEYHFQSQVGPAPIIDVGYGRMPGDSLPLGEPAGSNKVDDFSGKDVKGKIALIERGHRYFETKIANAKKAGAIGVIVWDNNPLSPGLTEMPDQAKLPAVFISNKDGVALSQWVAAHANATATLSADLKFYDETPNLLTDFSSRGYGPNYLVKPDVVAPGQDIYSATQSEHPVDPNTVNSGEMYDPSGFASFSGTSFSAPHTTGEVALLKGEHPKWTPSVLKATVLDTAKMVINESTNKSQVSSVQESGAGLIDAQAAVNANAYLLPASLSFGGVNDGYGAVHQAATTVLHDVGGGAGSWQGSVSWVNGAAGLTVTVPSSVSLASGGSANISLQLTVSPSVAAGDYGGYGVFTKGSETLHVPFIVHVSSTPVKQGSVLLIDDSWSRFQSQYPEPAIKHVDVTKYYTEALSHIGKRYTYWNEKTQGTPTLADMKRSSGVILFTGANVNDYAVENNNTEALEGPVTATDASILDQYLQAGGHVFITGRGAALSVPYFTVLVLGAWDPWYTVRFSLYDTPQNDNTHAGSVSPPKPSTRPALGTGAYKHVGPFAGLKAIDLSTKGNGARTNLAAYNTSLGDFVGVAGLKPAGTNTKGCGSCFGRAALALPKRYGKVTPAVASSSEPTLTNAAKFKGRSIIFSFGFEGINDNTGFATREQVLKRIFQWFNDKPVASVVPAHYAAGQTVRLRAALRSNVGSRPGAYEWQIGLSSLGATSSPTTYRFRHAGTYRVRVLITDTLGHAAQSPWLTLHVG
jgi:subtilisin family serine protease